MRVGIFSGTFNPVHEGHLLLAKGAQKELQLDQVLWVPTPLPPHKSVEGKVSPKDRAHMVELAIQGNPSFHLSRVELDRSAPYYTVDTVELLKKQAKDLKGEWFLLVGSDDAKELPTWHQYQKLLGEVQCVVVPRPGYATAPLLKGMKQIQVDTLKISSSEIRQRIREGHAIRGLVPESVQRYIEKKGLYR